MAPPSPSRFRPAEPQGSDESVRTVVRAQASQRSLRQAFGQALRPGHKKQPSTSSASTQDSRSSPRVPPLPGPHLRRQQSPEPISPIGAEVVANETIWPTPPRPMNANATVPPAQVHVVPRAPVGRVPRQMHTAQPPRAPSPQSFIFDEDVVLPRGAYTIPPAEDIPMINIQTAMAYVLQNEGSGFVWVEDDHGGPTKFGITQGTLTRWLGRPATVEDVRNLTVEVAQAIYQAYYWTPVKAERMPYQSVATALLDIAVLTGTATAAKLLQASVSVTQDGVIGPVTLAACNARTENQLLSDFSQKTCQFFAQIALRDPTQPKFLPGWMVRAHKMNRLGGIP